MAVDTGTVFACKGCEFGGAGIDGVTHGRIVLTAASRRDRLRHASVVTQTEVSVEIYGNNPRALVALLGVEADDVVFTVLREDGSEGSETLADVDLVEPIGAAEIPEADGGGKLAAFGVRGICRGAGALAAKWASA